MHRFSDFSKDDPAFEGDKIGIEDVLNIEIAIIGFTIKESKFKKGNYLTLQIVINGEKKVLFTGSSVLANQMIKYKSQMPFLATIKKINKYYILS